MAEWMAGDWDTVGLVALTTLAVYLSAVFSIRFLDRRALAEMSGFDFVVAVAMGTIVGRTATTRGPSLVQGMAAIVVLLLAHRAVSWARARWKPVNRLVDRQPLEIVRDGTVDAAALEEVHLTEEDVRSQLRLHGFSDVQRVHRMVVEASGKVSIVPAAAAPGRHEEERPDPTSRRTDDGEA